MCLVCMFSLAALLPLNASLVYSSFSPFASGVAPGADGLFSLWFVLFFCTVVLPEDVNIILRWEEWMFVFIATPHRELLPLMALPCVWVIVVASCTTCVEERSESNTITPSAFRKHSGWEICSLQKDKNKRRKEDQTPPKDL